MTIINHTSNGKTFGCIIALAVVLSTVVAVWAMLDPSRAELTERFESGLLVLFLGELALEAKSRWRSPWFAFDAVVMALALVPLLPLPAPFLFLTPICRTARLIHLGRHHLHHLQHLSALHAFRLDPTLVVGVTLAVAVPWAGAAVLGVA